MLSNRIARARGSLGKGGLDAVLITNLFNIRYLSGFTGSDGMLLLTADGAWLLTDSRYTTQAAGEAPAFTVTEYSRKIEGVAELVSKERLQRVGVEGESISLDFFQSLKEKLAPAEVMSAGGTLASLRAVKEEGEIVLLRRAASVASRALDGLLLSTLRPGLNERDAAIELEWEMRRKGADDRSFDFIVASGLRGALPHGKASQKLLEAGELVTIDFGCVVDGYCSDETVTVSLGRAGSRQKEIYGIVKEAHDRAIAAVRPGTPLRAIDAAAREFIAEKGFGGYFGHGTGHGIGLEVHEKPTVSARSDDIAEEGMVFTVEPGIYIPGWGGVRIEDTVCVTPGGCTILTQAPKDLLEV